MACRPIARRSIARTLVAAAGGLLGVAYLPGAVAFADSSDIGPVSADAFDASSYTYDPVAPETVTGFYNKATAPPGVNDSLQGYQLFHVDSGNASDPVGTFDAYESTSPYLTPYLSGGNDALFTTEVLYISPDAPGYVAPTGVAPPAGSVISINTSGYGSIENIYSAIPSGDTDTVTDTLKTPFGTIDLSQFVNSLGFDAANVTPVLPDGITPADVPDDLTITAVNGLPPLTFALQGVQTLELDGANPFTALETTTEDGLGFHTEAFLVTDNDNNPDALPVGSIYNTIDFRDLLQNVYSSIPQGGGLPDKITDTLVTPFGNIDLSSLFSTSDASLGLQDGSSLHPIAFGADTIHPVAGPNGIETFTGVNGLPPGNASIQGTDTFGIYADNSNTPSATFTADVTNVQQLSASNYAESLLVTNSSDPALPDGSVIDTTSYGIGVENVYSDLPGLGAAGNNLITDTLVTPFGNIDLSSLVDASAGLTPGDGLVSFMDAAWLDLLHI